MRCSIVCRRGKLCTIRTVQELLKAGWPREAIAAQTGVMYTSLMYVVALEPVTVRSGPYEEGEN